MTSRSRRGSAHTPRQFPRTARINEILREVLADALERMEDLDERLGLLTITSVDCDPDLRHAVVYFSSLDEGSATALSESRARLQGAISSQVRIKRTPLLRFARDPAVEAGERVEEILRSIHVEEDDRPGAEGPPEEPW
jgi:ribosome-binding factor A